VPFQLSPTARRFCDSENLCEGPLHIIGVLFFIAYGAMAGAVATFFLYLLLPPINVIRLRQMRRLIKTARISARQKSLKRVGDSSMLPHRVLDIAVPQVSM
jgi:hypothetical protein